MQNVGPPESGIIDQERFCIGCGYNLRTLHWSAKCPECGRDVLDSLGPTLQSAERSWLRSIYWGMVLLAIHSLVAMAAAWAGHLLSAESWIVPYLASPVGPKTILLVSLAVQNIFAGALSVPAMLIYGIGIWMLTRADATETVKSRETRLWLRLLGIASPVVGVASFVLVLLQSQISIGWLIMIMLGIVELAIIGLTYTRLAHLADFAGAGRLATVTRWLLVGHLLTVMFMIISFNTIQPLLVSLIMLAAMALAGIILWVRYLQLLSAAMRRD